MTYELALKLREAGFPFKNMVDLGEAINGIGGGNGATSQMILNAPTLEELIDACKPARILLTEENENEWFCFSNTSVKSEGKTPSEAVARLWLLLNNK